MPQHNRLIVFLIPPQKLVNGGILSIFSICKETRALESLHKATVLLATYPGTKSYQKNDLFDNSEVIHDFEEILQQKNISFLQLHVPEYASSEIFSELQKNTAFFESIADVRVNILNQNILLMPKPLVIAEWFAITTTVTQTTAHSKYATQVMSDSYNTPLRHLSTYLDPSQYNWTAFETKQNIIALSPDISHNKQSIVDKLTEQLPNYTVKTIKDMRYEDYKALMSSAKFAVTFGEGFDGYYLEGFFSGGVTFAVYNENFFPSTDFADFDNLFSSEEDMLQNIVNRIKKFENEKDYTRVSKQNFDKITELYSFKTYQRNIKKFYEGDFSFLPSTQSSNILIGELVRNHAQAIKAREKHITEQGIAIADMEKMIASKSASIAELDAIIASMINSHSWKVTKPLRAAIAATKKK